MNNPYGSLRFFFAILLSVGLHSTGLFFFSASSSGVSTPHPRFLNNKKIVLEFIPASPNVSESIPLKTTHIISEKSSTAVNPISKPSLIKEDPYQHGTTEHKTIERRPVLASSNNLIPQKEQVQINSSTATQKESVPAKDKSLSLSPPHTVSTSSKIEKPKIENQKLQPHTPKPELARESGPDDFTSPSRKNLTTTAQILDEWSYNSKSHAVARYFSNELKKISNVWQMELYSSKELASSLFPSIKKTVVIFKIMTDGHIQALQVIEHKGDELAQRYPILAIEKTAPFSPLPTDVLSYIRTDGLWVKIEFNYDTNRNKKS